MRAEQRDGLFFRAWGCGLMVIRGLSRWKMAGVGRRVVPGEDGRHLCDENSLVELPRHFLRSSLSSFGAWLEQNVHTEQSDPNHEIFSQAPCMAGEVGGCGLHQQESGRTGVSDATLTARGTTGYRDHFSADESARPAMATNVGRKKKSKSWTPACIAHGTKWRPARGSTVLFSGQIESPLRLWDF